MNDLYTIRKQLKLTQSQLGTIAHISRNEISNIERRIVFPGPRTRTNLERALNTKIHWLNSRIKVRKSNYRNAESLLKRLIEVSILLDEKEKEALKVLISKHFKN